MSLDELFSNDWFIGIVGGVISSLIASAITGLAKAGSSDYRGGCSYGLWAFVYSFFVIAFANILMIGLLFFARFGSSAESLYARTFEHLFGSEFGLIVFIFVLVLFDLMLVGKLFFGVTYNFEK